MECSQVKILNISRLEIYQSLGFKLCRKAEALKYHTTLMFQITEMQPKYNW